MRGNVLGRQLNEADLSDEWEKRADAHAQIPLLWL